MEKKIMPSWTAIAIFLPVAVILSGELLIVMNTSLLPVLEKLPPLLGTVIYMGVFVVFMGGIIWFCDFASRRFTELQQNQNKKNPCA